MFKELLSDDIHQIFVTLNDKIEQAIDDGISFPERIELIIAGSAPLIYNNWISRDTEDIDYVYCSDGWIEQFFPQFALNSRIQAYSDSYAYNYEERLESIYESEYLSVLQLCLEDLIFMKLCRWRENDIKDIGEMLECGADIDFDLLAHLVYDEEESRGAGMTDRTYDELLAAYKDFQKRLEESDWKPQR